MYLYDRINYEIKSFEILVYGSMQNTSAWIQHVNAYEHKYVLHLCDMKCKRYV